MTADARRRLKSTADNADMEMEMIHDTTFIGNMEGLSYARQVDSLQARLSRVEKRLDNTEKELGDTKLELGETKLRVIDLEESVGFYGILRNRFLSTFKRDKLQNATPADIGLVATGNVWAYEGNASRDADLYQLLGRRTDFSTYKALYGLHHSVARDIGELRFETK